MLRAAFVLLTMLQSVTTPAPQDEIRDAMAHAAALYDAARFSEAMTLLTRIDDALSKEPGRLKDRVETKLQLALNSIGLNDADNAKAFFIGLYALDPDFALDAEGLSPKVITVAAEAKAEQTNVRCYNAQTAARTDLDSGQTAAFLNLIQSSGSKCTVLAAMGPEATETFYRAGITSYKRGDFSNALSNFETALTLSPEHELARQYADLTDGKVQLGEDRLLVQWQQEFDAHHFDAATADYRKIMAASRNGNTTARVTAEYRKALAARVENWNRNCGQTDAATMISLRGQISELLPEPSFAEDIRGQMISCETTEQPASVVVSRPQAEAPASKEKEANNCIDMQPLLALARLKTRIDPIITDDVRRYFQNNPAIVVRVKARISENGDVLVSGMPDVHPSLNTAIRSALIRWKFTPIRDDNGPRCVNTEIPLTLKIGQ